MCSSWRVAFDESANSWLDVTTVVIFIIFIELSCGVHVR
jgi:hypothetical protein